MQAAFRRETGIRTIPRRPQDPHYADYIAFCREGFRRYLPWVMRVSGILLILVGLLMITGEFTRLAGWLQGLTPDFIRSKI